MNNFCFSGESELGSWSSHFHRAWVMAFFSSFHWGFSASVALRPDGRECSFFSPRALTVVSARGFRGCRSRWEVYSQVTRHTIAQLIRMLLWTYTVTSVIQRQKQQQHKPFARKSALCFCVTSANSFMLAAAPAANATKAAATAQTVPSARTSERRNGVCRVSAPRCTAPEDGKGREGGTS